MDILPETDTCVSFMRRRYCYMHNAHVQGYLAADPSYLLSDLARPLLLVNLFYSSLSGACELLTSSSIAAQGLQFL